MNFCFATCERHRALKFIRASWSNITIEDTPEDAGEILDLISSDIIRIEDPDFHPVGTIIPGKNWDENRRDEVIGVCREFNERCSERNATLGEVKEVMQ